MARFRFLPAIHSIAAALAGRSNTTRINQPKTSILFWKGAVITQTFEAAIVI
jgi:diphthamide synthase subunit DPH2